jgi:hypothetical protein
MTPVDFVVERFGGVRNLARSLNICPSSVSRWKQRGKVPLKHWEQLLYIAQVKCLRIKLEDLVDFPIQHFPVVKKATPDTDEACNSATTKSICSTAPVAHSPVVVES